MQPLLMTMRLLVLVCITGLLACQKENTEPTTTTTEPNPPVSSAKSITAVVLKAADNASLTSDISGVVSADSVNFTVPRNTSLKALVPTIEFIGQSITPGNRTPQNFSSTVVYTVKAEDGTQKEYGFSVSWALTNTERLLVGRWVLLRDSLWETDNFYYTDGAGNHHPTPGVYYGAPADYWEFGANGRLAVKENNLSFSKTYQLTADTKLDIEGLTLFFDTATIDTLTTNALSFYWNKTSPNGGRYFRKIYLKK